MSFRCEKCTTHRGPGGNLIVHQCKLCETRQTLASANALIGEAADEAKKLQDAIDARDSEITLLRAALVAARDVAADRELFVRQGPRGFAKAVAIIDVALKDRP